MYGAQLIEAMRACWGTAGAGVTPGFVPSAQSSVRGEQKSASALEFFGAGGERMRAAGCDIVVDARDLAVVGITEVVSHLPKILGLYKKLIAAADERCPDAAVVIDAPAFNWRVARQMRQRGIPVIYYVCPQFWAWRQGRVKLLRENVNKALVIFPFEEKFYRDRGVDATFVGHPLADLPMPAVSSQDYAAQHSLDPAKPWITLMPGSRRKEVRMNLPTILQAKARLGDKYEYLLPVAPTLGPEFLRSLIDFERGELPKVKLVPDALPALRHARAAIVASGTATVEAALMETPFVMVYRVSPLTYALGKPRIKVPYLAMVNLIAGAEIVPELVQRKFTAENIVEELRKIIPDGPARDAMVRGLKSVRQSLQKPAGAGGPLAHPANLAAEIILQRVGQESKWGAPGSC